mmetsp:Transcript_37153/g.57068  ORF Transcript_37153/g.57068 Transcript_37153/m.57068 type:complete len:528 (+) Transcript_37153:21-1604(+)
MRVFRNSSSSVSLFCLAFCSIATVIAQEQSTDVVIEDFANPINEWEQMNDPVMGGKSTGQFTIEDSIGNMYGNVAIAPIMNAPGFIKAETKIESSKFPDVTTCEALKLTIKSTKTEYKGYRVSFGIDQPENPFPYAYGYKADFSINAPADQFVDVVIPFHDFSDDWNVKTGAQVVTCGQNPTYCPSLETLKNMRSIAVWAEGEEGSAHLGISKIVATECFGTPDSAYTPVHVGDDSDIIRIYAGKRKKKHAALDNEPRLPVLINGNDILIEDFENPTFEWYSKNDPVMGGKSSGTANIEGGIGVFDGQVVDVPFLKAPGFITMETSGEIFPDVSFCDGLVLEVRSSVPYSGYRVSFGSAHAPGGRFAYGFKTPLDVPVGDEFGEIQLPFSSFSDKWDDATGDIQISCQADSRFCPDDKTLKDMDSFTLWGEGVAGKVHLEIKSIRAVNCGSGAMDEQVQGENKSNSNSSGGNFLGSAVIVVLVLAALGSAGFMMRPGAQRTKYEDVDYTSDGRYQDQERPDMEFALT